MKLGLLLGYSGADMALPIDRVLEAEKLGFDSVWTSEAYGSDAITPAAWILARTTKIKVGTAIIQMPARTPAMAAMTAMTLDALSGGRFILGIGPSGPQVIEGWHGVPYDAPLQRTREIVEICRQVWRRKRLDHQGKKYTVPLPADQGTGLGKPLKLINIPVRDRIPVMLAALGPKNVELAAEIAEAWEPIFFVPEKAASVWGDSLAAGKAKRDPELGDLQVITGVPVAIGDDVEPLLDLVRPAFALYIGGMGARGKNFYNDLAVRYGYEAEAKTIQDLYLDGKKDEAAAAVPDELVRAASLIGPESYVAERIAAFAEAGVTTLMLQPLDGTREGRLKTVETMKRLS